MFISTICFNLLGARQGFFNDWSCRGQVAWRESLQQKLLANQVWKGITVQLCPIQYLFKGVMWILMTFSAFCGPSPSFRYMILQLIQSAWKRHEHHITVRRSHSLCDVVSNLEPLGGNNNWTFQLELELSIVAESSLCNKFEPHCGISTKCKSDVFTKRPANTEA